MTTRTHEQAATAEAQIRSAFEQRYQELVRHLAATATVGMLASALAEEDSISGLAVALARAVELDPPRDPLAAARARGVATRERLLERAGGALRVGEVAKLLGVTPQAVQARRARGTLLALPQPNGENVYPRCQFGEHGVVEGLGRVLAAFREVDPWTQLGVLLAPARNHDGRSALDLLRAGEVEAAVRIAAAYGEHLG